MRQRRVTVARLAVALDVPSATVTAWNERRAAPSTEQARRVAVVLRVPARCVASIGEARKRLSREARRDRETRWRSRR